HAPARLDFAHPRFLGKPFVLGPAERTVNARKEHRRRLEAFAIRDHPRRNVLSRLGATDHHGSHVASPCSDCWLERGIAATYENCLTPRRPYRDEMVENAAGSLT